MTSAALPPGPSELLLVPTELERARLLAAGLAGARLELCGFGPVAAAARTAELLARHAPSRVCLLGIAGTFDPDAAPLECARVFATVAIDGIGAGRGASFRGPRALGLPQWPGATGRAAIHDRLALARPAAAGAPGGLLVTVPSASGSKDEARERRERFPGALAEDMEGFGVALACALAGVPLAIVRGISNQVGERDPRTWRIDQALAALVPLAREVLRRAWESPA